MSEKSIDLTTFPAALPLVLSPNAGDSLLTISSAPSAGFRLAGVTPAPGVDTLAIAVMCESHVAIAHLAPDVADVCRIDTLTNGFDVAIVAPCLVRLVRVPSARAWMLTTSRPPAKEIDRLAWLHRVTNTPAVAAAAAAVTGMRD